MSTRNQDSHTSANPNRQRSARSSARNGIPGACKALVPKVPNWTRVFACVAAMVACLTMPAGLVPGDSMRTALWGVAILVSAVGWGALFARYLYGDETQVDWGLEAALGMAAFLALGGLLAALSLVSVTTSYIAVTSGVVLFAFRLRFRLRVGVESVPANLDSQNGVHPGKSSTLGLTAITILYGFGTIHYLGSAAAWPANIVDDFQAYFSFPKQLLATGTLEEPFSSRRIDTYGGQSYLQAIVLAFSTTSRIGVFDNGICVLVLIGLVVGWVRERPHLPLTVALPALFGLLLSPYPHFNHNAASEFSGAVFFLAMFRVFERPRRSGEGGWADALALALVASAACTMRQTNFAAAALIPLLYYGIRIVSEGDLRWRWAREAMLAAIFSVILLLPWMALAYRACGTPIYPLILGSGAKDYVDLGPISLTDRLRYFFSAGLYQGRIPGLLLTLAAGFLVARRTNLSLRASLIGTALATILLFYVLAPADDVDGTDRYAFSYLLAYFLAVSLVTAGHLVNATAQCTRSNVALTLIISAVGLQLIQGSLPLGFSAFPNPEAFISTVTGRSESDRAGDAVYETAQRAVPEGATLLVMLDQPFRLDFKRNRILLWDQPGAVSPAPHLPIGENADALAKYLLDQGIRYVAYCDGPSPEHMPDPSALYRIGGGVRYVAYCDGASPPYSHSLENFLLSPPPPRNGKSVAAPMRNIARFYTAIFADLQALTVTRRQLFVDRGIHVLDLGAPAAAHL